MNLSVNTALRDFGEVAAKACETELVQLFIGKKTLVPVRWDDLTIEQRKKVVRSHMFLREKFEDGKFVTLKARLVANGRTQDRTLFQDFMSPTTRTRSVFMCLKVAASKGWSFMKIDIGGALLCAKIDEEEKVYLHLDKKMSELACGYMPELSRWLQWDETLVV
jgi:hypothetical protein